ncbi:hypothetical protein, partial [Klebsiella pneumoniae]|uniref:hypothetical protein n=1 Tax=Klebsiella pneumoniae TaxID=573 RepID=UPI00345DD29A
MAPVVSSPAALRLPGRGVGFRGAFREKTPAPSNKKAGFLCLSAFFFRFFFPCLSWRWYFRL